MCTVVIMEGVTCLYALLNIQHLSQILYKIFHKKKKIKQELLKHFEQRKR